MSRCHPFFFFNDTATTEIYPLSLHDALPISRTRWSSRLRLPFRSCSYCAAVTSSIPAAASFLVTCHAALIHSSSRDRKSTRLNSSHSQISYAVFCLKKKKNTTVHHAIPLHSY